MVDEAYVTLVATDSYAAGALVLGHRLRDLGSQKALVCLVTSNVSATVLEHLSQLYTLVSVDTLISSDKDNLRLLGRPELDITFTKLHLWNLTQYKKVVFLDADTLPLRNVDDLFCRPNFSAAPDAGWPDCFNSGVFVTEPSAKDYQGLKDMALEKGSFDGGDQGLLNSYFSSWSTSPSSHRLPFTYNATPTSQYSYAPAHQYYVNDIAICHFIGTEKPWKYQRFADGKVFSQAWKGLTDLIQSWWDTWNLHYGQSLPHVLLSKTPMDSFDYTLMTGPINLFNIPIINAWDTSNVYDDIEMYEKHRHIEAMPPIANITISTPKWLSQQTSSSSYPGSSDMHTLDSLFDDTSQYSSHINDDETLDDVVSITDQSSFTSPLPEDTNVNNITHHQAASHTDNKKDGCYQIIDWNPAHDSPPNTGMAANIPDLSNFVNAWDQPLQHQTIWIAPEPQPIPNMEHDYGFIHERQRQHRQYYPPVFPWESEQIPEPTRIWLDEHVEMVTKENSKQKSQVTDGYGNTTRQYIGEEYNVETRSIPFDEHHGQQQFIHHSESIEEVDNASPTYAMDLITHPIMSPGKSPKRSHYSPTESIQTDNDWSDRDLIPIQLKPSSKLNKEGLSPVIPQSPIGSRRSSISRSRRASASSSRSQSRSVTAPTSPAASSSPTPTSTPVFGPRLAMDYSQEQQPLPMSSRMYYSKQTPYTSAAATPVRENQGFFDEKYVLQNYMYDGSHSQEVDDGLQENDLGDDFYWNYSFDESLQRATYRNRSSQQHYSDIKTEWDPQAALTQLKSTSESILCSREYEEAVERTNPEDSIDNSNNSRVISAENHYALDNTTTDIPAHDSIRDQFNASGNSSPKTPVARGMDSNLTGEIETAKEQYRQQQRAALSLVEPQTAMATLLEVELDLSKSKLFNRRSDNTRNNIYQSTDITGASSSSSTAPTATMVMESGSSSEFETIHDVSTSTIDNENDNNEEEPPSMDQQQDQQWIEQHHDGDDQLVQQDDDFVAYFDSSIMETARRKLNALAHDVSVTSMSSTATMNDVFLDETISTTSQSEPLQNLSRYSFPDASFEYTTYDTPTMDPGLETVELSSSSISSSVQDMSQRVDHNTDDSDTLLQSTGEEVELEEEVTEGDLRSNESDLNNNNVSTWLSLTTDEMMHHSLQSTVYNDDDIHHSNIIRGDDSQCSDGNSDDNSIIIGTIDLLTETADDTLMDTHTTVEYMELPSTSISALASSENEQKATIFSPAPTIDKQGSAYILSGSDDNDTVFLSAAEGTLTSASGSSSVNSMYDWYTVGSSTPIPNDDDENDDTVLNLLGEDDMETHTATARSFVTESRGGETSDEPIIPVSSFTSTSTSSWSSSFPLPVMGPTENNNDSSFTYEYVVLYSNNNDDDDDENNSDFDDGSDVASVESEHTAKAQD
ncbi:uncharacterized protein BX664DRAFT_4625 [Halteromyces radiatus]|uniref:uncharacterized protein n=1 Tax=Halteromyces radiatus TaxID=101107 RepID=UPI00221F495A|nr:uncharacterized protein BX664DRAFT_4625 [Halteromyces radiatus]KAI8098659.1 hypothetical protein BX664DRAFT_4625 [Halteromyces radiatus]